MKYTKLITIMTAAALIMLPCSNCVYARGGGHGGGGHSGGGHRGGWSGGHGHHHGGYGHHGHHSHHGHNNHHGNHSHHNTNVNVYGGGGYWGGGWGWGWGWGWGGGGWGWGVADGAIAGLAVGTAIGVASQPSTVIVEQQAPVPQQAVVTAPAYGTQVAAIPAGAIPKNVQGSTVYQYGSVWYKPYFGSSGVYYEVVAPPSAGN